MGGNIVRFFFFLAFPSIWWGAWNRVREPWHRGLFFSQVRVLIVHEKSLKKTQQMIRTTFKKFSSKVLKKRTNKFWNSLACLLLFQVNDMISTSRTYLRSKRFLTLLWLLISFYSLLVSWPGKSKLLKWDPEMDFRMKRYRTWSTDILFLISSTHYKIINPTEGQGWEGKI